MGPRQPEPPDDVDDLVARLKRILEQDIGLPIDPSRARHIMAKLLDDDGWRQSAGAADDKRARPAEAARARRKYQIEVLERELKLPQFMATDLRAMLALPGDLPAQAWTRPFNLPLAPADEDWCTRALVLTSEFHRTVLPIYTIVPATAHVVIDHLQSRPPLKAMLPDVEGVSAHERLELLERVEKAAELASELYNMVRALGKAPILFPLKIFALTMRRSRVSIERRLCWSLLGPEPWLEVGYEAGLARPAQVDLPASRALRVLLALRREFIEAGWTDEGSMWEIAIREANYKTETFRITAPDAGKAVAAFLAACSSLRLASHSARLNTVVLLSASGPDGALDPRQVVAAANKEPLIMRGKLFLAGKLRARTGRSG